MAEIWDSLEAHPAWREIVKTLTLRQQDKFKELVAVGLASADARVRGVAQELVSIDYLVMFPQRGREMAQEAKTDAD